MARPRKDQSTGANIGAELKDCPRCGGKCTGAYTDKHGNYRCNCAEPKCGFWDSVVSLTPEDAKKSWQLAGGPNKETW